VGRYLAIAVLVTSLATNAFLATAYYWSMDHPAKQTTAETGQGKNAERPPKRPDLVDTLSGLSNVVIAFFTIALFSNATSLGAMEESRKANVLAELAANAAQRAADTAYASESPYLSITLPKVIRNSPPAEDSHSNQLRHQELRAYPGNSAQNSFPGDVSVARGRVRTAFS